MSSAIAYLSAIIAAPLFMLIGTSRHLNGWTKACLVVPIVLFVVYLLARIPPSVSKESKSRFVKAFDKSKASK